MQEATPNPDTIDAQVATLKSRRAEAAIHAGVYMVGGIVLFAGASGLDIGMGHGNETVSGVVGYGLGLVGAMYGLLSLTSHDEIRKIEQQHKG